MKQQHAQGQRPSLIKVTQFNKEWTSNIWQHKIIRESETIESKQEMIEESSPNLYDLNSWW